MLWLLTCHKCLTNHLLNNTAHKYDKNDNHALLLIENLIISIKLKFYSFNH